MALIFKGNSKCSICNKILEPNEKIVVWKAFLNEDHEFWKYSDTGMHQECFDEWEHKTEFVHLYNYQPLINFDDVELTKHVKYHGMPDWLKEIKDYRKNKALGYSPSSLNKNQNVIR